MKKRTIRTEKQRRKNWQCAGTLAGPTVSCLRRRSIQFARPIAYPHNMLPAENLIGVTPGDTLQGTVFWVAPAPPRVTRWMLLALGCIFSSIDLSRNLKHSSAEPARAESTVSSEPGWVKPHQVHVVGPLAWEDPSGPNSEYRQPNSLFFSSRAGLDGLYAWNQTRPKHL